VLCVLIVPVGGSGRWGVEEHATVCPWWDPREVGLPGKRWLRRHSAKRCKHGGHLARARNGGVPVPVYLAPLQPQKHGSDSKLICGTDCSSHLQATNYTELVLLYKLIVLQGGTRGRSWLRPFATNRKVAGSIPDCVIGIFH
jgi:hypothetical protein